MRLDLRALSVMIFSLISFAAKAQDAQQGWGQDSAPGQPSEPGARAPETTEDSNSKQGGFLGMGAQKPMQRVRGIPLPNSRSPRPLFASAQPGGVRDASPSFAARRSKPAIGDLSTDFPARMIYLNGKNVSSVRDQQLEGVTVRIDSNGNLHISAPHYEVQESTHYRPLLPHDVPRVSKPVPQADEPLLSGRYSKPTAKSNESNLVKPGSVPPIETDDNDSSDAAGSAKAGADSSKPAPTAPEKPATEGQKL